jgi:uncharacterized protein YndB with AHSA1/START domain
MAAQPKLDERCSLEAHSPNLRHLRQAFSGFGFILLSSRVYARPPATLRGRKPFGGKNASSQRKGDKMRVQKSIEIAAPPQTIWPFFIEPEKVLQWCITFKKFEYTGNQQSGVGTPLYIEEQAGGSLTKMQFEVTEWKENEKLSLRMVSGTNYRSYNQQLSLEPIPIGSRFTFSEEIIFLHGVIGKLIGLIAQKMSAATVGKMLTQLKKLAKA